MFAAVAIIVRFSMGSFLAFHHCEFFFVGFACDVVGHCCVWMFAQALALTMKKGGALATAARSSFSLQPISAYLEDIMLCRAGRSCVRMTVLNVAEMRRALGRSVPSTRSDILAVMACFQS